MKPSLMQRQIDLFGAEPPARRLPYVERMWKIAFSDQVRTEVLALIATRSGEWLDWEDFRPIIDKYKIGAWFGHLLFRLSQENALLEQRRYFGSQYPWEHNFLGSGCRWAAIGTQGPLIVVGACNGR